MCPPYTDEQIRALASSQTLLREIRAGMRETVEEMANQHPRMIEIRKELELLDEETKKWAHDTTKLEEIWKRLNQLNREELLIKKEIQATQQTGIEQKKQELRTQEIILEKTQQGTRDYQQQSEKIEKIRKDLEWLSSAPESKVLQQLKTIAENFQKGSPLIDSIGRLADKVTALVFSLKTIELQNIQNAGGAIFSGGQTPLMNALFQREMTYQQGMLQQEEKMTRAGISIGTSIVSGAVGLLATGGNPLGAVAGISIGSGVADQVSSIIEASAKKQQEALKKSFADMSIFLNYYQQALPLQRNIALSQSLRGNSSDVMGMQRGLLDIEAQFMGIPEMTSDKIVELVSQIGMSRQFQGMSDAGGIGMSKDLTGLMRGTGLGREEILQFFVDLKMKLGTPTEELVGRFTQLNQISKDLSIPLKTVIGDLQGMIKENVRYGFSQEQLIGLYASFGEELKKGTVSASQLSEYMKGIADLGRDKTVGIGAMMSTVGREELLSGYSGNKKIAGQIYDAVTNVNPLDVAYLLSMMANPNANYEEDPKMMEILRKSGLNISDLKQMQPEMGRMGLRLAQTFSSSVGGDVATQKFIEEKIYPLFSGKEMPTNMYDQMLMYMGMNRMGTTKGVMGMGEANMMGANEVDTELTRLGGTINKFLTEEYEARKLFLDDLERFNKQFDKVTSENTDQLAIFTKSMKLLSAGTYKFAEKLVESFETVDEMIEEAKKRVWGSIRSGENYEKFGKLMLDKSPFGAYGIENMKQIMMSQGSGWFGDAKWEVSPNKQDIVINVDGMRNKFSMDEFEKALLFFANAFHKN